MWYGKDERTDNERYLEQELEDVRRREEESREREQQAREQQRREWAQQREEDRRTAETWPEALRKQEFLMRREANFDAGDPDFVDDYFAPGADACKKALEYWQLESKAVEDEITQLEQKIIELRKGIASSVADKLDAHEGMLDGWYSIAASLREYDEDELDSWLYW